MVSPWGGRGLRGDYAREVLMKVTNRTVESMSIGRFIELAFPRD